MTATEDRRVHGRTADGLGEIVRYDRAGAWYLEPTDGRPRRKISVTEASRLARQGQAYLGKPGGKMFDAQVRGRA